MDLSIFFSLHKFWSETVNIICNYLRILQLTCKYPLGRRRIKIGFEFIHNRLRCHCFRVSHGSSKFTLERVCTSRICWTWNVISYVIHSTRCNIFLKYVIYFAVVCRNGNDFNWNNGELNDYCFHHSKGTLQCFGHFVSHVYSWWQT